MVYSRSSRICVVYAAGTLCPPVVIGLKWVLCLSEITVSFPLNEYIVVLMGKLHDNHCPIDPVSIYPPENVFNIFWRNSHNNL